VKFEQLHKHHFGETRKIDGDFRDCAMQSEKSEQ